MTGSGGGNSMNSMASTGSFLPNDQNPPTQFDGKDHYGIPMHVPGLSFHEKTLLGLMGWWMAMNILGIFYALFAIDYNGDGIFQSETTASTAQKFVAMVVRIFSLGVFGTRPRPSGSLDDEQAGGGASLKGPGVFKFLVALLGFLFLGVLFPSNITSATESFIDLGDFPDFFGKSKNKPGDILGNATNVVNKLMGESTSTSTLTKEHKTILNKIRDRNDKFKTGTEKWEKKFNNIDFSPGGDWASKVFGRKNGTYYIPKKDEWKHWRKKA